MVLRVVPVRTETAEDWRRIHNLVVPTAPLSGEDVAERLTRNRLTLGYDGEVLVGNATVRPPEPGSSAATVIVRVLPEHRRQGYGAAYLEDQLAVAWGIGVEAVETVVLASNEDGVAFALAHGFVEVERYLLEGDTIPFVVLRRPAEGLPQNY